MAHIQYKKTEAAAVLRISISTLDRMVARGEIDSTLVGRRRIFMDYHIDKYLTKNEIINY